MRNYNMRKKYCCQLVSTLLALGLLALTQTVDASRRHSRRQTTEGVQATKNAKAMGEPESVLVDPLLQFGSKLMLEMQADRKNVIFSPVSIHSALNLVLLGAKNGSTTENELLKTLGYGQTHCNKLHESYAKLIDKIKGTLNGSPRPSGSPVMRRGAAPPKLDIWTMAIANGAQDKLEQSYLDAIQKYYRSTLKSVRQDQKDEIDKVVEEINDWAKEAGFDNGVIKSNDLQRDFSLLLLSAVRVEAHWFHNFHELVEEDELFYNYGQASQLVKKGPLLVNSDIDGSFVEFIPDVVTGKNDNYLYRDLKSTQTYQELAKLDFYAVDIPLKGDVSFACFVPVKNGTGNELEELEKELFKVDKEGIVKLSKAIEILDTKQVEIDSIRFPKFKFESDISLNQPLKAMGLKNIFDPERAEITKISPLKMYVSEAKHQAVIEVNKIGLKAAGVTTVRMVPLSAKITKYPIRITIDRPFLFIVRFNRVPMFMGKLMKL